MITLILATLIAAQAVAHEGPVDPYVRSNANAGATPFAGEAMLEAFHGRAGIDRIVDEAAMRRERLRYRAQHRLSAMLAPMKRMTVVR